MLKTELLELKNLREKQHQILSRICGSGSKKTESHGVLLLKKIITALSTIILYRGLNKIHISYTKSNMTSCVGFINDINRTGKGKKNVMYCLRRCLVHAFKSNRIPAMPMFPEEKKYNIVDPIIKWLPEEQRQIKVIQAIPIEHQPIFWWLKYHLRRPSEAAALHRCDYDKDQDAFIIRRTFSNNQLVQHTKTHKIHHHSLP